MLDAQKYSLDQVAAALGRREGAIRRRIATLGIKDRPVRNPGKWWTAEETETMTTMHRDGHTWEEIGAALGRTASACRGKYERILNPEQHTQAVIRNKAACGIFGSGKPAPITRRPAGATSEERTATRAGSFAGGPRVWNTPRGGSAQRQAATAGRT